MQLVSMMGALPNVWHKRFAQLARPFNCLIVLQSSVTSVEPANPRHSKWNRLMWALHLNPTLENTTLDWKYLGKVMVW